MDGGVAAINRDLAELRQFSRSVHEWTAERPKTAEMRLHAGIRRSIHSWGA
jgi:hypothetical protein